MYGPSVPAIERGTLMAIGRPIPVLRLTDDEREASARWARRPTTAHALAQRARGLRDGVSGSNPWISRQSARRPVRIFCASRAAQSRAGLPPAGCIQDPQVQARHGGCAPARFGCSVISVLESGRCTVVDGVNAWGHCDTTGAL